MPFTIETDINTSVTLFERGGRQIDPLVTPETVRVQSIRDAGKSKSRWVRPKPAVVTGEARQGVFERNLESPEITQFQKLACVSPVDGRLTKATRDAILAYLNKNKIKDMARPGIVTDIDGETMHGEIESGKGC